MAEIQTRRLTGADCAVARRLFAMMADVFAEQSEPLSDGYLQRLLGRADFWAIAALLGDDIVGGVTAHTLPMTRAETAEIFVYDIAVRTDRQRTGIGRQLIDALRRAARDEGIEELFVPADNGDTHALEFYRALGGAPAPVTIFTFPAEAGPAGDIT
jgi:aminoglycoside 3-N-acetyltransferase I